MPDSTPIKGNGKTHTDFNGLYISSLGLLCYFPLLSNPWIWLHIFLSLCITEFYPYSLALFSFGCYCGSNFLFVCLFKKLFIYFYFKKKKKEINCLHIWDLMTPATGSILSLIDLGWRWHSESLQRIQLSHLRFTGMIGISPSPEPSHFSPTLFPYSQHSSQIQKRQLRPLLCGKVEICELMGTSVLGSREYYLGHKQG